MDFLGFAFYSLLLSKKQTKKASSQGNSQQLSSESPQVPTPFGYCKRKGKRILAPTGNNFPCLTTLVYFLSRFFGGWNVAAVLWKSVCASLCSPHWCSLSIRSAGCIQHSYVLCNQPEGACDLKCFRENICSMTLLCTWLTCSIIDRGFEYLQHVT